VQNASIGMPSQSSYVATSLATASRDRSQMDEDLLLCSEVMQDTMQTPHLQLPVGHAPPKSMRMKQTARKMCLKVFPRPAGSCKRGYLQPHGLVDNMDLFGCYKTPQSRKEMLRMIKSARMKHASSDTSPQKRISLSRLMRHLNCQFDRLYTKNPPRSVARDPHTPDKTTPVSCQYTADMNAIQRSLTMDPVFEDLLVNRNVWSGHTDGVHGESMAVFSAACMDVAGFTNEEYDGHSARYMAFVKDIDEGIDPGMLISVEDHEQCTAFVCMWCFCPL
jgi:hypothetical protein